MTIGAEGSSVLCLLARVVVVVLLHDEAALAVKLLQRKALALNVVCARQAADGEPTITKQTPRTHGNTA
jgi:hypothetical protein